MFITHTKGVLGLKSDGITDEDMNYVIPQVISIGFEGVIFSFSSQRYPANVKTLIQICMYHSSLFLHIIVNNKTFIAIIKAL